MTRLLLAVLPPDSHMQVQELQRRTMMHLPSPPFRPDRRSQHSLQAPPDAEAVMSAALIGP